MATTLEYFSDNKKMVVVRSEVLDAYLPTKQQIW